jgi:hypothetical protein
MSGVVAGGFQWYHSPRARYSGARAGFLSLFPHVLPPAPLASRPPSFFKRLNAAD